MKKFYNLGVCSNVDRSLNMTTSLQALPPDYVRIIALYV